MPTRDVVAWNAMIQGHVKYGKGLEALELSRQMQQVDPDPVTFVPVLNACASVMALEEGRGFHGQIIERGYESDVFVASGLVDMYAKCGSIEYASRVFDKMSARDVVVWNAMLAGYATHGHAKEGLEHFQQMCEVGVVDWVIFISLLSACSHAVLVDQGLHYFESMRSVYRISPTMEHYSCVVDLLGRAGRLHDANDLISRMPCEPGACVWMSLLATCRVHGNVEMGERIAKQVVKTNPENSAGYVLASNIYAAAGRWEASAKCQDERIVKGLTKTPGRTWIEVNNEVHLFEVGENKHPRIAEIRAELKRLFGQMEKAGYAPDTRFVLHWGDEEQEEFHLCPMPSNWPSHLGSSAHLLVHHSAL